MSTLFQFQAVAREEVAELLTLSDEALGARGARRMLADAMPGFPCRVSLVDAPPGEAVLLLHFTHHPSPTPYRSSGPIFVRLAAATARPAVGEVPEFLRSRLLSVRAYDERGTMVGADVAEGRMLESVLAPLLSLAGSAYLHVHNARTGCYLCRVERA